MNSKDLADLNVVIVHLTCGGKRPIKEQRDKEFRDEFNLHERELPERSDEQELREDDYRQRVRDTRE